MKILVSLHIWNKAEEKYADTVIKNYQEQFKQHQLTYLICVRSKPLIELPTNTILQYNNGDALTFCWYNTQYIDQHYTEYDYIIQSDSDILITIDNFNHYVEQEAQLPSQYICGYLVYENANNKDYLINMPYLHKQIDDKFTLDGRKYIVPTNLHSCCYIINTNKYIVGDKPFKHLFYVPNDTAMSRFYFKYQKVVSFDDIFNKKALIQHLSNKYYNNEFFPVPTKEFLHNLEFDNKQ